MLRTLGCDDAQGYFMSRPLDSRALATWIQANSSSGLTATFNAAEAAASMKMGKSV
jgi:hypothetical protein